MIKIIEFFKSFFHGYKEFISIYYPTGKELAGFLSLLGIPALLLQIRAYSKKSIIRNIMRIKAEIALSNSIIGKYNIYLSQLLSDVGKKKEMLEKETEPGKKEEILKNLNEVENLINNIYSIIEYQNSYIFSKKAEMDGYILYR